MERRALVCVQMCVPAISMMKVMLCVCVRMFDAKETRVLAMGHIYNVCTIYIYILNMYIYKKPSDMNTQ